MLTDTQTRGRRLAAAIAAMLLLAFAFGALLGPSLRQLLTAAAPPEVSEPAIPAAPPASSASLRLLQIEVAELQWQRLAAHRERALQDGIIQQDPDAEVPVAVRLGDQVARGKVRLKGDWIDHVDSDQWSLRLDLDEPIAGMRRFSVQHPKTRGFVMEWLVMKVARKLDVLAPRVDFVRVSINGGEERVYYLEEHASKQLLESQGRKDGPIVRFDEAAMWGTWMQYGWHRTQSMPAEVRPAASFFRTEVQAYGEGHLRSTRALEERLLRALQQARGLQQRVVVGAAGGEAARPRRELRRLEGKAMDELFAIERVGAWLALHAFFNGLHGLAWHQLRFYHDPLLDRLEPLVFDTGALLPMAGDELLFDTDEARWFTSSPRVRAAAYRALGRLTEPAFLDELFAELRAEAVLAEVARRLPGLELDVVLDVLLRQQAERVRARITPQHAIGLTARLCGVRDPGGEELRFIEVDAWSRSKVSTQLSRFRFGNGRELAAAPFVVGLTDLPQPADGAVDVDVVAGGAVLLPIDGSRVRLRFPVDERLATLGEIQAIKRAIRARIEPVRGGELDLEVYYRPVAERVDRSQPLLLRRDRDDRGGAGGRPAALALDELLTRHRYLDYDVFGDRLSVRPGRHDVAGDLVLPERLALHLSAGTELRMAAGAVLVAGALQAHGEAGAPIRIVPRDPAHGFAGVLVLGTAGPSALEHVEFRGAHGIERGPWQVSGGVTFRARPVTMRDCRVLQATGEDALNLVGLRMLLERCEFVGGPHDLFDGDFVTGEVVDCRFAQSGEDAIDVSGSEVLVRGCRFEAVGDKALSVGEASRLVARDCVVGRAAIAIASKDRSQTIVERMTIAAVEQFVAAAYVKKAEFGAATLQLRELRYAPGGAPPCLVQIGCSVSIDGVEQPAQDVDVEALYRDGVLGK